MNTSLVFAELIVIGLEGGIWLVLLFLWAFGGEAFGGIIALIKDWQLLALAVALPLTYVVGVIVDRFADWLFWRWERNINRDIVGEIPVSITVMRYSLGIQNDFLNQQLEYTRTRLRIVRASTVNFPLIAVSLSLFLFLRLTEAPAALRWQFVSMVLAVGALFTYASYHTWKSLIKAHLRLAKEMYEYQNRRTKRTKSPKKRSSA